MKSKSFVILLLLVISACSKLIPKGPASEEILAEPISGLSNEEAMQFIVGDEAFAHIFSEEDGLGPMFIQNSCESCHAGDGKGHPENKVTRFGKWEGTEFDYMVEQGGPQLQDKSIPRYPSEEIPASANTISDRLPPIVTGLGYLAYVSDQDLIDLADPNDLDNDGISGKLNYVQPNENFVAETHHIDSSGYFIGRFGKKAKEIRLIDQVVFALREDMGISSDLSLDDLKHHKLLVGDQIADPEVPISLVEALDFYMHSLKAPSRRNENDKDVLAGEQLFAQIGCNKCHVSTLKTTNSKYGFLSNVEFHPYTDLLLHDMGSALNDNYPEGNASGSEWRTPPLWGIGLAETSQGSSAHYLHDGRAKSLEDAISYHLGGEAKNVASKYYDLTKEQQENLIKFLKSL